MTSNPPEGQQVWGLFGGSIVRRDPQHKNRFMKRSSHMVEEDDGREEIGKEDCWADGIEHGIVPMPGT